MLMRMLQAFADRYCQCNVETVRQFYRADTVFLLAFATIMLNTDLHNKNIKPDRKMKLAEFIRNLRGIVDYLLHSIDIMCVCVLFQSFGDKQTILLHPAGATDLFL